MPQDRPIVDPNFQLATSAGAPIQNAVYAFYISGTSTPQQIYDDPELSNPIGTTLTTNALGRISNIGYADPSVRYKCILTIPSGPTITTDPWITAANNIFDEDTAIEVLDNLFNRGDNIVAAGTTDLTTATEYFVDVTGNTQIDSFGNLGGGDWRFIRFTGTGQVTYNGASQIIQGGENLTRANGDMALVVGLGSSSNLVIPFPISGKALNRLECLFGGVALSDETTSITTGAAKVTCHVPYDFTLTDAFAGVTGASSSGPVQIDVNKNAVSIFSTTITIEEAENTSLTAATQPVLSTTSLAQGDTITFDIDAQGTSAEGAKVYLIGFRT